MTAMNVSRVIERRFLDLLEQMARDAPPGEWKGLHPGEVENLRPAAGVLLRLADLDDRAAMVEGLKKLEETGRARRQGRGGGEEVLWISLQGLIEGLSSGVEGEATNLWELALWKVENAGQEPIRLSAVDEILGDLRPVLPPELPVREEFLTQAARILLRARGAEWRDEARRREGSGPGATAGGGTSA